jgi:dihydrofolate synthase/folylpolyglutamate synthase
MAKAEECGILGDGLETTDCRLWFADQCGYMRRRRKKEAPECQLKGIYQDKNQQTAFVALQVLRNFCGVEVSQEAVAKGFEQVCSMTGLRGRWEVLSQAPLIVCDTGHNGHGMRQVAEQLKLLSEHSLHIVLGMVGDKDVDTVLGLLPDGARYYFTAPATSRALPAKELLARWQAIHPEQQSAQAYERVGEAIAAAQANATEEDAIFIGGSNYVVGEAIALMD